MAQPPHLSPTDAYEAIQSLLDECDETISVRDHAWDRMDECNANLDDVLNVLRTGTVSAKAEWDDKFQNWKYSVSGLDLDGDALVIVVALEPKHCRITLITVKDRSQ